MAWSDVVTVFGVTVVAPTTIEVITVASYHKYAVGVYGVKYNAVLSVNTDFENPTLNHSAVYV